MHSVPLCHQFSKQGSILHFRIRSLPYDNKLECFLTQASACTPGSWPPFHGWKEMHKETKVHHFELNNISSSLSLCSHQFWLIIHLLWHNKTAQHNFGCFYNTVSIIVMQRELVIALHAFYLCLFLEMKFSVAKTLTFAFEIFRCKMKQE